MANNQEGAKEEKQTIKDDPNAVSLQETNKVKKPHSLLVVTLEGFAERDVRCDRPPAIQHRVCMREL